MMYRDFWEAGYRVFPLFGADKHGKCQCGDPHCKPEALYKHPRLGSWQNIPLFDEDVINNFEEFGWFSTGYGVLCKELLVIDVDARNGGVESLAKLTHDYPSINESNLEVATGSGGGSRHIYFSLPDAVALIQAHKEYPGIDFKSSGYVVGPGSMHASGGTYEADGYPTEISEAPADLIALLRKPERHRTDYNGTPLDVSHSDIAEMLSGISANMGYEQWVRIGMAVHHATDGTGFEVWDQWSATAGDCYNGNEMADKWHSFGRSANPVTIGTLIHHAQEHGWKMPISMMDGMGDLEIISMDVPKDGLPFDIAGIDLKQPPGFVGKVAEWIESQSRRPRKNLAVAAALTAVGNIAGLRYTDDKDGVTTNLFTFCVAGSRTGKESIQQAVFALHKAAGILPASHGSIKSEQEVTRNLLRHQSAMYIVDEIGIFLQKIKNAQTRGGASYLDGVIGILMNIYSKASGWALLGGDMKEDLRGMLAKELSQFTKKANDSNGPNDAIEERIKEITRALENVDKGLDRPFLSLIGFTTPETFVHLVDFDSATNGFIGRAMLFQEQDTAPRSKRGFKKSVMDTGIEMTARALFYDGDYDQGVIRVENYKNRSIVPTDAKASAMMDDALDWLENKAIDQRGEKGLEALWLGAYELVSKISLVLAVAEGVRTTEHVRWAFAAVKRDIETKIRLVVGNDDAKRAPVDAMRARIEVLCSEEVTYGIIKNRLCKTFQEKDILSVLAAMVDAKALIETRSTHPRQKIEVIRYRTA